jgi:4-hydroxyphenylacetate 3-monooxygenase
VRPAEPGAPSTRSTHPTSTIEDPVEQFLMSGEQYKESLRDGRRVVVGGEQVEDVTTHPAFAPAVDLWAELFDAQLDPATQDITTFVDEDLDARVTGAWLIPRSAADYQKRRDLLNYSTDQTLGMWGRPPDYGPTFTLGFVAEEHRLEEREPGSAERINAFIQQATKQNYTSVDLVTDAQSDRSLPAAQNPGRLRCVEETDEGIVLYGAKPVASAAAQSHITTIGTLLSPGIDENSILWAVCPINTEGITLVSRESFVQNETNPEDHPLNHRGEEPDTFMLFENVFLPKEYLFSFRNPETLKLYLEVGALGLWHILARLARRGEIFATTAKMIVNVLGTERIPAVRAAVADVQAYAAALKAFTIAGEQGGTHTQSGVFVPDPALITAGRLHSIVQYPKVMQTLRDLSGQGLVSRMTQADWDRDDIGPLLDEFLPGHNISARGKNRFFNFVWDLTCSSHASRVALFENTNATPPPTIRQHLYEVYDDSAMIDHLTKLAQIEFEQLEAAPS